MANILGCIEKLYIIILFKIQGSKRNFKKYGSLFNKFLMKSNLLPTSKSCCQNEKNY